MDDSANGVDIKKFRDGIFALRTRRFGSVAEIMIKRLYGFDESCTLAFDKHDRNSGKRIEIKFSTVMRKNKDTIRDDNVVKQCLKANIANRALKSSEAESVRFDCNIQQVKRREFDVLYYGLFFADHIEIFRIDSDEIQKECPRYSDKQHRGNKGEGQFHLNQSNIRYHRDHFLTQVLTYDELFRLLN